MSARYLITGALGCIGAWTIKQLVEEGSYVLATDLNDDRSRLRLVAGASEIEDEVTFARADVTNLDQIGRLVDEHSIDRIIHLAALQVPASHANPPAGAAVNVVGTTNILAAARAGGVERVVFASSVAVYGADLATVPHAVPSDADQRPDNFYGVFKRADEAVAHLYHRHYGVQSVGLRPHTVYGVGRDTGLTSSPTWAMLAAVKGEDYEIPFSGSVGLQWTADVAQTFIRAAEVDGDGETYSIRGSVTNMAELARLINDRSAGGTVTVAGDSLPFPSELDESGLIELIGDVPCISIEEGIEATMSHFRASSPDLLPRP